MATKQHKTERKSSIAKNKPLKLKVDFHTAIKVLGKPFAAAIKKT